MSGLRILIEMIIALLATGGLLALCWGLFGRLLAPVAEEGVFAVVRAAGAGERLEHDVSSLLWLRAGGLAKPAIIILDEGLDEMGLAIAAALLKREAGICLCKVGELESCIRRE